MWVNLLILLDICFSVETANGIFSTYGESWLWTYRTINDTYCNYRKGEPSSKTDGLTSHHLSQAWLINTHFNLAYVCIYGVLLIYSKWDPNFFSTRIMKLNYVSFLSPFLASWFPWNGSIVLIAEPLHQIYSAILKVKLSFGMTFIPF